MGNCFGGDVQSKYAAGQLTPSGTAPQKLLEAAADEAVALVHGSLAYSSLVELHFAARNLPDVELLSKSDPFCVVYELENGEWKEAGRTELIANTLNPSFVKRVRVLYNFEKVQVFRAEFRDIDAGEDPATVDPKKCYLLGQAQFELSEVITAKGKRLSRPLEEKGGVSLLKPTMVVVAEELTNCKEVYRIRMHGQKLRNMELIGKSDPFLQFSRLQEDGVSWLPAYKTSVVKNNLNPIWPEIHVRATQFNNGDLYRPLRIECYDYESDGDHHLMGVTELTTLKMQELARTPGAAVQLGPPPGKAPGDYGTLHVTSFAVEVQPSFLDYLAGGTEIGFIVAVDFTASNGDPQAHTSKHFFSAGPTQYEKAIMGVGKVIEAYDHDKVFPMYGFGGSYQRGVANHCFPLGEGPESVCNGIQGLLAAYRQALCNWSLSGPTLFTPIIRKAIETARSTVGASPPKYTCLLILTDGVIMDKADTVEAVIDASTLPLSILIVGIGQEDFSTMEFLDSDDKKLTSSSGRVAARDIVQFVEFDKFAGDGMRLAQELLAELPGALLEYMRLNNIPCPKATLAAPTMLPGQAAAAASSFAAAPMPHTAPANGQYGVPAPAGPPAPGVPPTYGPAPPAAPPTGW